MINKTTNQGEVLDAALVYAGSIANQPLEALLATKRLLRQNQQVNISEIVCRELDIFLTLAQSEKTQNRVKEFTSP